MARKHALARIKRKLLERRDELSRYLNEAISDLSQHTTDAGSGDDGDAASDSIKMDLSASLAEHESRELDLIDHAVRRIEGGRYGVCEMCGKNIPVARLEIMPFTTFCVKCQKVVEDDPSKEQELRADWAIQDDALGQSSLPDAGTPVGH